MVFILRGMTRAALSSIGGLQKVPVSPLELEKQPEVLSEREGENRRIQRKI